MKMRACLRHFASYAKKLADQLAIPAYIVLSDKNPAPACPEKAR